MKKVILILSSILAISVWLFIAVTMFMKNNSISNTNNCVLVEQKIETNENSQYSNYPELAKKIYETRYKNNKNFTQREAFELLYKVAHYADKHNLDLLEALVIINVESDFKTHAYNRNGEAYGLCQITQTCLDEYNLKNKTHYDLIDAFDPDINLEVGFWYYNRILTRYNDHYEYIEGNLPIVDAYIAYNVGVTIYHKVGFNGRKMLREGKFPLNAFGYKCGDTYRPILRLYKMLNLWGYSGGARR